MDRIKIVVLGDTGVGKTSITIQYVQNKFVEDFDDDTLEESFNKKVTIKGTERTLEILDPVGDSHYEVMQDLYMKNGDAFILVYSITSRSSFEKINEIREKILVIKDRDRVPMVLVGNKCDLKKERQVSQKEGKDLSSAFKCSFYEASAKKRKNIKNIFENIVGEGVCVSK